VLAACTVNTMPVTTTPAPVSSAEMAFVTAGISDAMKDPDSALFRKWRGFNLSNGDRVVCGEVNAKNSFGGYVGYEPFYIRLRGSDTLALLLDTQAASACNEAATGSYKVSPT
jgi:hypothetical protein